MADFDEREKGFEAKYYRDQEMRFRVLQRRNRLLGLWVAEQIGVPAADVEAYARDLVDAHAADPTEAGIRQRIAADLSRHDVVLSDHRLHKRMAMLMEVAWAEVAGSGPLTV